MVKIEIAYRGELRCEATHGPSGSKIFTDAPTDNHGKGESFSPTDLVATALGTCVITIMAIVAEKNAIDLSGARVTVEKHMSSDLPRRIVGLPVTVEVASELDSRTRAKLEAAALNCPVHNSIHPDIETPTKFIYSSSKN